MAPISFANEGIGFKFCLRFPVSTMSPGQCIFFYFWCFICTPCGLYWFIERVAQILAFGVWLLSG